MAARGLKVLKTLFVVTNYSGGIRFVYDIRRVMVVVNYIKATRRYGEGEGRWKN